MYQSILYNRSVQGSNRKKETGTYSIVEIVHWRK
jgi:hypothetical protein